ncbi:unnamed protein product [Durusdinium trenchii]|uniref:Glycosyltransferase 2-like domain-containing protein n=1 Tax=Durusdinium trenchii TaxID=1381693 RepID=A0ABP0NN28_9DINO
MARSSAWPRPWMLLTLQIFQCVAMVEPDLHRWIPFLRPRTVHPGDLQELREQYRVVVVMTTIPQRIQYTEPVIDSMLRQTWPANEIYMSVPYVYNRTGESYQIPSWMASKPSLRLFRCEDLGPGTHLLNGLRLEEDPWTFLVVVDDDHIYGPELIEQLMRSALGNPGSAVAAQGFLSVPGLLGELVSLQEQGLQRPRYLQDQGFSAGPVLVSYLGVVYQRGFFDERVFEYGSACQQCRYQDDMWFSAHLALKGIRRFVLGAALGVQELTEMHLGPESLTLWPENRPRNVSDDCNQCLVAQRSGLWAFRRRVVLALSGLPSAQGLPEQVSPEWQSLLASLRRLSAMPDLVYLCTDGWEAEGKFVVGTSFLVNEVLITGSTACNAHAEARVSLLLRDLLLWEGDANTVLVMGSSNDFANDPEELWAAAECAADMYDLNSRDLQSDERALREAEQAAKQDEKFVEQYGHLMLNTRFQLSASSSLGDQIPRRSRAADAEHVWPYCRLGSWVAASVGAFNQQG